MAQLAPVTFTLQEGYVLSNKAQAVDTVSRAFDVPVNIRANIRSLHETLGELTDALEDLDLRNVEKALNSANEFYNAALNEIEDHEDDLEWLTLLLKALSHESQGRAQ